MTASYNYKCTQCGEACPRTNLTVKRVQFVSMGEGADTKKSRVLEWLCPSCVRQDPDFNRDRFVPPQGSLVSG